MSGANRVNASGSNVAQIILELLPSERRGIASTEIINRWRNLTGAIPDVLGLNFSGTTVHPGGRPIEVRFAGEDIAELRRAAGSLKTELKKYPGVYEIEDDYRPGKLELRTELKPQARIMGVSLQDLQY